MTEQMVWQERQAQVSTVEQALASAEELAAQGDDAGARRLWQRAIMLAEQRTADALYRYALFVRARDGDVPARPLCERAYRIARAALGLLHEDTRRYLSDLIEALEAQEDRESLEQLCPLYQDEVRISELLAGPEHPTTALALAVLALAYKQLGAYGEALPLFKRALYILEQTPAEARDHDEVQAYQAYIAECRRALNLAPPPHRDRTTDG